MLLHRADTTDTQSSAQTELAEAFLPNAEHSPAVQRIITAVRRHLLSQDAITVAHYNEPEQQGPIIGRERFITITNGSMHMFLQVRARGILAYGEPLNDISITWIDKSERTSGALKWLLYNQLFDSSTASLSDSWYDAQTRQWEKTGGMLVAYPTGQTMTEDQLTDFAPKIEIAVYDQELTGSAFRYLDELREQSIQRISDLPLLR